MARRLTIRHASVVVDGTEHPFNQGDMVPDELAAQLPPGAFAPTRNTDAATTDIAPHQSGDPVGVAPHQSDGEAPSDYASMHKEDLEQLAADRGLEVEGTGADGNVLKDDLVAALEAADAG